MRRREMWVALFFCLVERFVRGERRVVSDFSFFLSCLFCSLRCV